METLIDKVIDLLWDASNNLHKSMTARIRGCGGALSDIMDQTDLTHDLLTNEVRHQINKVEEPNETTIRST